MAPDHPKKPFNLAVRNQLEHADKKPETDPDIRDKDNADPRLQPSLSYSTPQRNLAPAGTTGIRRGLPSNEHKRSTEETQKDKEVSLSREFKSVAGRSRDSGPTHDR